MPKKLASIVAAGTLAVDIAAPAPAMARPAGQAQEGFIISTAFPFLFSSLGSSMLRNGHCGPLTTQHC